MIAIINTYNKIRSFIIRQTEESTIHMAMDGLNSEVITRTSTSYFYGYDSFNLPVYTEGSQYISHDQLIYFPKRPFINKRKYSNKDFEEINRVKKPYNILYFKDLEIATRIFKSIVKDERVLAPHYENDSIFIETPYPTYIMEYEHTDIGDDYFYEEESYIKCLLTFEIVPSTLKPSIIDNDKIESYKRPKRNDRNNQYI